TTNKHGGNRHGPGSWRLAGTTSQLGIAGLVDLGQIFVGGKTEARGHVWTLLASIANMRLPDGNPSAVVRTAASGCRYSRDHLPSEKAAPASRESGLGWERAWPCRTTLRAARMPAGA